MLCCNDFAPRDENEIFKIKVEDFYYFDVNMKSSDNFHIIKLLCNNMSNNICIILTPYYI